MKKILIMLVAALMPCGLAAAEGFNGIAANFIGLGDLPGGNI